MGTLGLLSTELARVRPGIQLRRLFLWSVGVPGRDPDRDPGGARPPDVDGLPLLCGLPLEELPALLARSWFTANKDGGGGRGSFKSRSSAGPEPLARDSLERTCGDDTWRAERELPRGASTAM